MLRKSETVLEHRVPGRAQLQASRCSPGAVAEHRDVAERYVLSLARTNQYIATLVHA